MRNLAISGYNIFSNKYKFYQNKESKKVSLKSALESLYEELEETKLVYNSII